MLLFTIGKHITKYPQVTTYLIKYKHSFILNFNSPTKAGSLSFADKNLLERGIYGWTSKGPKVKKFYAELCAYVYFSTEKHNLSLTFS